MLCRYGLDGVLRLDDVEFDDVVQCIQISGVLIVALVRSYAFPPNRHVYTEIKA